MSHDESRPLESVLHKLDDAVVDDHASLDGILNEFGDRSFGPILTLCGVIMITPLGAIPGAPIIIAACIIANSLQLLLGRNKLSLPKRISGLKVSKSHVKKSKAFMKPIFERIDGHLRPRMSWAATKTVRIIVAIISIVLALLLLILSPMPFGAMIPGALIAFFGLGIMARDGLVLTICFSIIIVFVSMGFMAI